MLFLGKFDTFYTKSSVYVIWHVVFVNQLTCYTKQSGRYENLTALFVKH